MNFQAGNLADFYKTQQGKYLIAPLVPHYKREKIRFTGALKKMDEFHSIDKKRIPYDYHGRAEYIYGYRDSVIFLLPIQPLQPDLAESEIREKWKGSVNPPNWKFMASIPHMTPIMQRIKQLCGSTPIHMPFPEPYSTPEQSKQIVDWIESFSFPNLTLWTLTPLPHLQPRPSVPKVAKKRCSQPSVASSRPLPAAPQLSDAPPSSGEPTLEDSVRNFARALELHHQGPPVQFERFFPSEPPPFQPISQPSILTQASLDRTYAELSSASSQSPYAVVPPWLESAIRAPLQGP